MTTRDPDRRPKHAAGNGEVPPWWTALDRRRLALALGSTFVAVPVVVLDNLPQQELPRAEADELDVVASSTTTAAPRSSTTTTSSTSTTLPPPSSTTITVEAEPDDDVATLAAPTTAPPTTAAPATTTTAQPPPPAPPTTVAPAPPSNSESGKATWYRWRAGECAHKTLPRGTVVTITNVSNGRSATCVVTDRGPYGPGRIIDLDDDTFAQLAPLSTGIIDVTITW